MGDSSKPSGLTGNEIAIIGMACRLPGADDIEQFWRNLVEGVESLTELTAGDLRRSGVDPALLEAPDYVHRAAVLDDIESWDADFFGYTPLEAKIMDPQQRLFMECAWEAFEGAGYNPEAYPRPVGVFTGAKTNTYLFSLFSNRELFATLDNFQIALGNDLASMATRLSYKLDLRGPSYALHTACSTSLVAVHLACQSLLLGECEMALAGGAAINVPQRRGYRYQKGGILSPDGSCRTFDAAAAGSNFGNGVGAVLLKRAEDALADGDHVYAVIRGSAANNDGARKASYTAPGVEGQTDVLIEAMAAAGVDAETISYVEAHGTATELGDSIEMLALTQAFRAGTDREGFCALGSVKTNIGHLETAAGVAGLIKTAMALERGQLPPSLHFREPNPRIQLDGSPFFVNAELREWESENGPRRAGVSSFGIGSTNVHAILEEAPPAPVTDPPRPGQLLLLSARTETALEAMTGNLAGFLRGRQEEDGAPELADVAYTLKVGRKGFSHRRAVVCRDRADAVASLESLDPNRVATGVAAAQKRPVVFLFPGLGDHYLEMGLGLYQAEPAFRRQLDRCAELFRPLLGEDLRELIFPRGAEAEERAGGGQPDLKRMLGRGGSRESGPLAEAEARLNDTRLAQPAMFAVEYALARMWMDWGVRPKAMLGYSLGEYVAAAVAGALSLEDAARLVAERARLIGELPAGAMLTVPLPEAELTPRLEVHGLSLAAVNGPELSVAAGPEDAVSALEAELSENGILCRRLPNTHAFHSAMMEPAAESLTELARGIELRPPAIPYLSNLTGTWITAEEIADPGYWARHMCQPVRFADGLAELLTDPARVYLEAGPGGNLGSFLKQHPSCGEEASRSAFPSLRNPYDGRRDRELLLATLGRLWLAGVEPDWQGFYGEERRRRVPLPTYPFERQRYWVDPAAWGEETAAETPGGRRVTLDKQEDVTDWFYRPAWREAPLEGASEFAPGGGLLVFTDACGLGDALVERLLGRGHDVIRVVPGDGFERRGAGEIVLDPASPGDYDALLAETGERRAVLHLWGVAPAGEGSFRESQDRGFYSLLQLAQSLGRTGVAEPVKILAVTAGVHRVTGDERLHPARATALGPARVIPQELPGITCRSVDLEAPEVRFAGREAAALAEALLSELSAGDDAELVAYRGGTRRVQGFEPHPLPEAAATPELLEEGGVYLLTGGLGGLGLVVAEHLARTVKARLVLTRRSPFPEASEWDAWLSEHGGDDPVSKKITRLRELEALGSEVLALDADVADEVAMRRVLEAARERFGRLDGVFHLAGIPGGGIIQLKTREMAERILAPKARGARVLQELLAELPEPPRFLLLFSSVASILGEFGQADYCGANAFLDALAQERAGRPGPRVITVNWDIWQEVGLAVETEVPEHLKAWRREMLEQAMTPAEGVEALGRILAAGEPQVVVSAQDLPGRIELGKSFTGESFLAELAKSQGAPAAGRAATTGRAAAPAAGGASERRIAEIWARVLGTGEVGVHDNFFDLGGNSLIGLQLVSELSQELGVQIAPVTLFESPTVAALAKHLGLGSEEAQSGAAADLAERRRRLTEGSAVSREERDIAIVAMTGRFPGAGSVEELWQNLREGKEAITFFTDEQLEAAGVPPEIYNHPRYVRAGAVLEDVDRFDASLFGYSPREAEVMDPQHRIFLECAWEALERAGYDPSAYPGMIGVFAGSNLSTYLLQLHADPAVRGSVNMLQAILGNDKDSLTTTVSYKLDLRGPSVAVQTFCSTSLVAVHMACRSLRSGECDMALAGGIRVVVPVTQGYLFEPGGIAPSDGHSRSFDAAADGSVLGNGVGIVVLKRLADALADGDPVLAVIKGTAINNDGSLKAGYTAPSVAGQAEAVAAALEDAGVDPATVSYVEAHGSATELGDPIEVAALTRAYRRWTDRTAYCPIGSVKSNFGHLDRAAGVTGLIKTVLALNHGEIPPSINFEEPNPQIDFGTSPFYVNTELAPWHPGDHPRRAGVNSLGMGGTNVHAVIEEAPELPASGPSRPWQLLVLSAASDTALDAAAANLARHFGERPGESLADAAYTLKVGRRALAHRRIAVCREPDEAARILRQGDPKRVFGSYCREGEREVVFLFPGLGSQYPDMARGLYESEETFRREVDRSAEILRPLLGIDLREVIFPERDTAGVEAPGNGGGAGSGVDLRKMLGRGGGDDPAARRLNETRYTQPALFVIEYALARLFMEWGVSPRAMLGYSLGEYACACLAGVMSLEDSLKLVAARARLIHDLPGGAMLAVALPEDAARERLGDELSLMAVNGPEQSVLSGPEEAIEAVEARLGEEGVACRRLATSHAFHSSMMEPIYDQVVRLAEEVELAPPQVPYISNLSGTWITPEEATDPAYWARHMCQPVRFSEGLAELTREPGRIFLEIGPQTLASLVLQQSPEDGEEPAVVSALKHSYETQDDQSHALTALGKLWLLGVAPSWDGFYARERRRRVLLPTYPFERRRYFIDAVDPARRSETAALPAADGIGRLYAPTWKRAPTGPGGGELTGRWLVFTGGGDLGDALVETLADAGAEVLAVRPGEGFSRDGEGSFRLDAGDPEAVGELLGALAEAPTGVVYLESLESGNDWRRHSFDAPGSLGRTLAAARDGHPPLPFWLVGGHLGEVRGDEEVAPEEAALLAAARALSRSEPDLEVRVIDAAPPVGANGDGAASLAGRLAAEIAGVSRVPLVALRGRHRWLPALEPLAAGEDPLSGGAHLLAGGLGDIAWEVARALAAAPEASLAVIEAPGFPRREDWDDWLAGDGGTGVVSRRIQRARELEELGAEVLVLEAELTDPEAMARAVGEAEERFGKLDSAVFVMDAEGGGEVLGALEGPRVLDGLLAEREPVTRLLLAPATPADGAGAEAAAPGFLFDALAAASGGRWTSVAWDLAAGGDAVERGAAVRRLFAAAGSAPQLVLSERSLPGSWTRLAAAPAAAAEADAGPVGYYPRPSLRVEYAAPRNPTEEAVAAVWRELLGVERVGIHDNFLDLGGDSLLATRLISRLRDQLEVDLPIRLVFEASTVAELSEVVAARRQEEEQQEISELLEMLDGLSEEEIESQLRLKREALIGDG